MWSHQPAGRPVTGTMRSPARCRRSSALYAAAVSLPSLVSVSSISRSTARTPRASSSASGLTGRSSSEDLRDPRALRLGHAQAALRPAPQHILRGVCPLAFDEVAELALGEPGTVVLAQPPVAEHLGSERAMAAKHALQHVGWHLRIALQQSALGRLPIGELAARKRRLPGPRRLHRSK